MVGVDEVARPSSFLNCRLAAVAVVTTPFFAATIIATLQVVGVSSPDDVVLILVVGYADSSLSGSDGSFYSSDGYTKS